MNEIDSFTAETSEAFVEKHRANCAAQDRLETKIDALTEAGRVAEACRARDELSKLIFDLHDLHLLELRRVALEVDFRLSQVDGFSLSFGGRLMHVDVRHREAWAPDPS